MAIPRGTISVVTPNRLDELPRELPGIPEEVSQRFPQVEQWQKQWDKWWFDFRTILQDQDQTDLLKKTIADLAAFKSSTTATLDTLTAKQANLLAQVNALQILVNNLNIGAINNAISALQLTVNNLSFHVGALTTIVTNNTASLNNLSVIVFGLIDQEVPLIVIPTSGVTPNKPLITGKMGVFGAQRAFNNIDGGFWTWNGTDWSPG